MHVREVLEQARRQVGEAAEDDAPHAGKRLDVIHRAVRDARAAKGVGHVLEAVSREPGQRDSREGQGIHPQVAHLTPAGHALDERPVERGVVGKHRRPAHEPGQLRHGILRRWRVCDVRVADVRERDDVLGDGHARVHEGAEPVRDRAAAQARGGNLGQLAVRERQARRLGVEDDDIVLKQAKLLRLRPLGEPPVPLGHRLRRVRQKNVL